MGAAVSGWHGKLFLRRNSLKKALFENPGMEIITMLMKTQANKVSFWVILTSAITLLAGCASMGGDSGTKVTLSGSQENPPVTTSATGSGTIVINADKSVSGSVTTSGIAGIAAHIHMGAAGKNGPVIVPMTKTSDNEWTIQAGAKLTDEQYASFKAGGLYVNVHSAANKGGEIRGQLKP